MERDRVLTLPLAGFLLVVAGVVGWAGIQRLWPRDWQSVLQELRDGDLEGSERRALLARLIELGAGADPGTPEGLLRRRQVALAAVARDDDGAAAAPDLQQAFAAGTPPVAPGSIPDLALGDPVLTLLLGAMAAEAAGDRAAAAHGFEATRGSARLFHMRAAAELARRGGERVR